MSELTNSSSSTKLCQPCSSCGTVKTSTNYLWDIWSQHSYSIPNNVSNFTLFGFSVAALRTNFYIRELNVMFDGGCSSNYSPSHLFITHLHTDHIANCPYHFNPGDKKDIQIYVPADTASKMENFLKFGHPYHDESGELEPDEFGRKCFSVVEVSDGMIFTADIKGNPYQVEGIASDHTVTCISYGLSSIKQKLKPEFSQLKGKEIKELKDSGVAITQEVVTPFFLYIGDTSAEILKDNRIEKYSTIMIECTFIDDAEEDRARQTKHIHWNHLEPYVKEHPNNVFILYHFSSRYRREFIDKFFEEKGLPNVIIWNCN